jgi:hypothetical protein
MSTAQNIISLVDSDDEENQSVKSQQKDAGKFNRHDDSVVVSTTALVTTKYLKLDDSSKKAEVHRLHLLAPNFSTMERRRAQQIGSLSLSVPKKTYKIECQQSPTLP